MTENNPALPDYFLDGVFKSGDCNEKTKHNRNRNKFRAKIRITAAWKT